MNIQIQETDEDDVSSNNELIQSDRGIFSMIVPRTVGESIDQCEQALLSVNSAVLRDAFANHLSALSEEKACHSFGAVKKTKPNIESMEK